MSLNFSYPMLSERELCGCLAELNLDKSKVEQCISKPDSETVQLIYEHLLSLLTGIDKQSLTTPVFAAMEDAQMEFPELHDESIPAVNLFIQVSKLLRTSGVRDFSMRDLAKPDPVRLRKHLSAVINFAKFREEKLQVCVVAPPGDRPRCLASRVFASLPCRAFLSSYLTSSPLVPLCRRTRSFKTGTRS